MFLYTSCPALKRCCSSGVSGAIGAAAPGLPGHSTRFSTSAARGPRSVVVAASAENALGSLLKRVGRRATGGAAGTCGNAYEPPGPPRAPGPVGYEGGGSAGPP